MVTVTDILRAQRRIRCFIPPSPLVRSEVLSMLSGADVWLKLECRQPTGSFKVRGALNAAALLDDHGRPVVTASAGNHGLGVAFAARALGLPHVTIFLPATAPAAKVNRLRRFPVTIHQVGQSYEDAHHAAVEFNQTVDGFYLEAYDDPHVIAGQGTAALEIFAELPEAETLLVPVGGGGLVAGISVAAESLAPSARILGVQPEASPAALLSIQGGAAIDPYDHEPTIADGLAGGFGRLPFELAAARMDQVLLVGEVNIRKAVYTLIDQEQLVVEGSGATAIAPLLDGAVDVRGQKVVAVLTGANIDTRVLRRILDEFSID